MKRIEELDYFIGRFSTVLLQCKRVATVKNGKLWKFPNFCPSPAPTVISRKGNENENRFFFEKGKEGTGLLSPIGMTN